MVWGLGGGIGVGCSWVGDGGTGVCTRVGDRASAAARALELKARSSCTYLAVVMGDCCNNEKKKESREKMSLRAAKWATWSPLRWWFMAESHWREPGWTHC